MKNYILLFIILLGCSCCNLHHKESNAIIPYVINNDSLERAIDRFVPINKDSSSIAVLEITSKGAFDCYKIYCENNAFALIKIPDLFFAKAKKRIIAVTYGNKPNDFYEHPDFCIKKEYGWEILKSIFPEQYALYKEGKEIEVNQYIRHVMLLIYSNEKCRKTKYIDELR